MTDRDDNIDKSAEELIDIGSEITGGVAGGIIGFLAAGPAGAVVGGASGPIITRTVKKIAGEIRQRLLGHREEVRIGATLTYAVEKIKEKIDKGQQVRQDDFFDYQQNDRPPADEILEGVLFASQKEHQEKKLKYYGNLLANLAFDAKFDKEQANHLLKVAQQLTYRQLCLLALFAKKENYGLRGIDYRGQGTFNQDLAILLQEAYELNLLGMLNCSGEAMFGLTDVNPAKMNVQGVGAHLHNLMELWTLDQIDIIKIAELLK
jgi:hypothetical protein